MQFENCVGLNRGERLVRILLWRAAGDVDIDLLAGKVGDQVLASFGAVGAGANDGDHVVEVIERGQVAFENVLAVFGFREQVGSAAADHVDTVLDEVFDRLHQAHFLGLVVRHRQQDHAEAFLHLGVLVELVEHELRLAVALQFDHDAHAVAIAFVADVGDGVDDLVVDQLRDALDQARLVDLVRNFGDDDGFAIFVESFDARLGAHDEAAASGFVGVHDSGSAVNDAGGGEIRALHEFQKFRELSASGLFTRVMVASTISVRLCGGIFVAMPTAIPSDPLTSRFGMRVGRTSGSISLPS